MTQVPGPEFQTNFKIPIKPDAPNMIPNMTSVVDMGCWRSPFDPNLCPAQPSLIPVWPQQPYSYQGMMTQTIASSTPTVISSPPVLNANGIKRKIDPNLCPVQSSLIPAWPQQTYLYQGMMTNTIFQPSPTLIVVRSPAVLYANGKKCNRRSPFDPNLCPVQTSLIPVWPQQPYPYQGIMSQTIASSTPTEINPPVLNTNGIKWNIYKDIMSELNDPSLPKPLTAMFQPLYCKLCTMHLNSSSNAKLHYQSKNHQKKVRKYLIEYAEKTGEPLHKRAKISIKNNQIEPTDSYCEICDLQLTSKLHAEQHYMGKNHHKAMLKSRPVVNSGYYDEGGTWHKTEKPAIDSSGRHGIGLAFAKPEEFAVVENKQKSKFYCDLCKVTTTSAEHLQMHISGQKHQKNLKKQGNSSLGSFPSDPFQDLDAVPRNDAVIPKDNILTSVIKNEFEKKDYSVYRTPSGWYYCQPCNVTLNSESQFVQHLDSKKHLKKKNTQK